jgi:pSer/pThr/pTyr-binding forkhead associated (FHA) protein
MFLVRLTRGGTVESEVRLDQADLRVGRATDNEIALQDPDKTLSRHHAELRREGDHWIYLDLNSANGSWLGERRVTRMELVPGLAITLGDYQLTMARVDETLDSTSASGEATQIFRRDADTLRPTPAPKLPSVPPVAARTPAPAVVGGAIAATPAAAAPAAPAGMTPIRRMIVFGSILVFGAFAVVLALLLRPDDEAPAAEPVASAAAPAEPAPAPAPPPPAPDPTPEPAATTTVTPPAPVAEIVASTAPAAAPAAPRPRPVRDTDPDAATIPARPGESAAALLQRRNDIRRRYALGLQRLAARQFGEAQELFAALSREVPRFRDLDARLAETDQAMRQQAADDFKAAAKLEESSMWTEAMAAYERLRPSAAVLPGLNDAIERTRKKMNDAGADALTRARQFDSRGRVPEAVAWYQRAVKWLPADHPGLEAARQRLAELVNRP